MEKIYCSVDPIVFTLINNELNILLMKRTHAPQIGKYALPGGLIDIESDKSIPDAVIRVLHEKTEAQVKYFEQVETRGGMRDPRGWTLSVSYMALVNQQEVNENCIWLPIAQLETIDLAFDHMEMIQIALNRLMNKVNYSTLPIYFLEDNFTLPQLQKVYEVLLNKKLEKSAFRKKIEETGLLIETGEMLKGGTHRPSILYTINTNQNHNFSKNISH